MPDHPQRRFVWPPRPVAIDLRPLHESEAETVEIAPALPKPRAQSAPAPPPPPRAGLAGFVCSIEEVWLGLSTPPLADRIAAAGWTPDPPDGYCARCGSTVGPYASGPDGCPACRSRRLPWERLIRLG